METAKEQVLEILQMLPEDASLEDIQYHIYVRQRVQQGLEDADAGRVVSHAEVQRRLSVILSRADGEESVPSGAARDRYGSFGVTRAFRMTR